THEFRHRLLEKPCPRIQLDFLLHERQLLQCQPPSHHQTSCNLAGILIVHPRPASLPRPSIHHHFHPCLLPNAYLICVDVIQQNFHHLVVPQPPFWLNLNLSQ